MTKTDSKTPIRLSSVIDLNDFKLDQANIIIAPCHAGKTFAALKKLPTLARRPENVLLLIDTCVGKDALLNEDGTTSFSWDWAREINSRCLVEKLPDGEYWGEPPFPTGIRVMTYHKLGSVLQRKPKLLESMDVLICDEMHNLIKYRGIESGKRKAAIKNGVEPDAPVCDIALKEIARASADKNYPYVFIMTATVSSVSTVLDELQIPTEYFDFRGKVTEDKTKNVCYYSDLKNLLSSFTRDQKLLIYCGTINQMQECEKQLKNQNWNVCCLWSVNTSDPAMKPEQLQVREHIIKTRKIPAELDALIINAAYETSINIENEEYQTIIVHNGNPDTQVQVRGRLSHDIDNLYLYDPDHSHISHYFPSGYYDRFLTHKEISEIVQTMALTDEKGHALKWPSIREMLEKDGIAVSKVKKNNQRGYIIHRQYAA
ncbi:MAG: hypothetical protein ACI4JC_02955 [Faecalibacterium sp.]